MKSHEAPPGRLRCCFRLPGKPKPQWKEKTSFPSSLGQHNSSPQRELELSEHVFILMTQPQMLPGLDVFQEGCKNVHCLRQGSTQDHSPG